MLRKIRYMRTKCNMFAVKEYFLGTFSPKSLIFEKATCNGIPGAELIEATDEAKGVDKEKHCPTSGDQVITSRNPSMPTSQKEYFFLCPQTKHLDPVHRECSLMQCF